MSRWRRFVRWLMTPRPITANGRCPECGRLVITAGADPRYPGVPEGLRPREELVAACRVHGRSPFNDNTIKWLPDEPPSDTPHVP
jgi:hypothetical protein